MTIAELKTIARHAANGTVPATFSEQNVDVNAAFADGLKDLCKTYNDYQRNKWDIYDIVIENADEILPRKVIDAIGIFAEIKSVPQGQKAMFKKKVGRSRARKFLTQVGLSGVYETFRLDKDTFEIAAHAVGGGATIDFERMLDGAENLAESLQIITDGLVDAVFEEVQKALRAAFSASDRPAANKVESNTFEADKMMKLINTVRAYGSDAVIFAPPEFVAAMGADAIVPAPATGTLGKYSPDDIAAIHNTGYITLFRGCPIVRIPQSFIDESNTTTWIDPQMAYILPTGGEKVVKVCLEGATQIREFENRDNSLEVYAWKKMGAGILYNHNWGIYKNTGIQQTYANPYERI